MAPDIIAIPVDDSLFSRVFSIEQFTQLPYDTTNEIRVWGFPENARDAQEPFYTIPSNIVFPPQSYAIQRTLLDGKEDIYNYYIASTIPNYNNLSGYSGSPVFTKKANSKKWYVLGVFAGHSTEENDRNIYVVKAKYFLNKKLPH